MLVVADVNTVWRKMPFEALAELQPVLGLRPMDPLVAVKQSSLPWGSELRKCGEMLAFSIVLRFGWATHRTEAALRKMWGAVHQQCRGIGATPEALFVTSPHYAPLVMALKAELPIYYYCSDNYQLYRGWDGRQMHVQEAAIVRSASYSFFVSSALRDRAHREYAVPVTQLKVSMNATQRRFAIPVSESDVDSLLRHYPKLRRPIVGVVGGINEQLDFPLLEKIAELSQVGTLLFVGPVEHRDPTQLQHLRKHPRVMFVGYQPHQSLPTWMQLLDLALIPYRENEFNYYRSPMRLFDHLASGSPIVATAACAQVLEFRDHIDVACNTAEFLGIVIERVSTILTPDRIARIRAVATHHTWSARAEVINELIGRPLSLGT